MNNIPTINEIDNNSPSQDSKDIVVSATVNQPQNNEVEESASAKATIEEIDATRKPTISEIYQIINDGLFEATTNWWDYSYKLSQAQINQDIISRLDKGIIGGGYNKPGVEIITTTSNKTPTNANVYSALKSDSLYPKKLDDENISGVYDFLNGITIGKFTNTTGARIYPDSYGYSHLDVDYLNVRLKAIFETLQILNVETIGGKMIISPAGSIRIAYVNTISKEIDGVTQDVYRCYFLGEQDGNEIDNKWKVGDQAQAKSFNVKKGIYHKVGNHYLWRLVVGVSEEPVEINGNKYHYVELSDVDCAAGSDIPQPGDVLNQLGYRGDDVQRQAALVFSAVDGNAPSITLYSGVNSYDMTGKEYVEYGVTGGKAYFNIYGETYIGARDKSTYIDYHNGKLSIKADISAASVGDKSLTQYIDDNKGLNKAQVEDIANGVKEDLQKQIDNTIETWFYSGEPTDKNIPAVEWKTDKIDVRKAHVGDLYYDQNTGYAYRYTQFNDDNNPYQWVIIKDTAIAKALAAADAAQTTADHKMSVYNEQPTSYKKGDIWVNATYADKFNNDIVVALKDNTSFDITDWQLASRYDEALAELDSFSNKYNELFNNQDKKIADINVNIKNLSSKVSDIDGKVDTWYGDEKPTLDNAPAKDWKTDADKQAHTKDVYYDRKAGITYIWDGANWFEIKDPNIKAALDAASAAQDTADGKRTVFVNTPTTPYDIGDLWIVTDEHGKTIKVATVSRNKNDKLNINDWKVANDSKLNAFADTVTEQFNNIIDNYDSIKNQVDSKAQTYYQAKQPTWTDEDKTHVGDIWYDTEHKISKVYVEVKEGTYEWKEMEVPDEIFDSIDGKSSIFVDNPNNLTSESAIVKGYNKRDIWILPCDYTIGNNNYKKGEILTAINDNTNKEFKATDWTKLVSYTNDDKVNLVVANINGFMGAANVLDSTFKEAAKDGIFNAAEKTAILKEVDNIKDTQSRINSTINGLLKSEYFEKDKDGNYNEEGTKLNDAKNIFDTNINSYLTYVTEKIKAGTYTKLDEKYYANRQSYVSTAIKTIQDAISSAELYINIQTKKSIIGDVTSQYGYLAEAIKKGTTNIEGGLVSTNTIMLSDILDKNNKYVVTAGINGQRTKNGNTNISAIAAWFGGPMEDKDIALANNKNAIAGKDYAMSVLRHDGTGYLAGGKISWDANGVLVINPDSILANVSSMGGKANLLYAAMLFEFNWKNNNNSTFNNLMWVKPTVPFDDLNIINNITVGYTNNVATEDSFIQIGKIKLSYDDANKALKISHIDTNTNGNLYTTGGIAAYGAGSISSGGGGLVGTVKRYTDAINITSDNETTNIASAYSIARLSSRIDNLASAIPSISVSVPTTGNALTSATYANGVITFTKGTFLTSHQSLKNYLTKTDASATYLSIDNAKTTYQPKGNYQLAGSYAAANHTHNYLSTLVVGKTSYSVKNNSITIPAYPTSLPASDVYDWAKADTKPSYSWNEINNRPIVVSAFTNDAKYLSKTLPSVYDANDAVGDIGFSVFRAEGVVANLNKYYDGFITSFNWGSNFCSQIFVDADPTYGMMIRHRGGDAQWNSWKEIITENNIMNQHVNISNLTYKVIGERFNLDLNSKGISILKFINVNRDIYIHFKVVRVGAYDIMYRESEVSVSFTNRNINEVYINCVGNALTSCRIFLYNNEFYLTIEGNRLSYGYTNLIVISSNVSFNSLFAETSLNSIPDNVTFSKYSVLNTLSKGNGMIYYDGNILSTGNIGIGATPSYKLHVAGDIYSSATIRTAAQNQAIVLSNNSSPAWISALEGQVIFNTGNAIRFGETSWNWDKWAGLKYNHSNKTIYLGLADDSVFTANVAQTGGTVQLVNCGLNVPNSITSDGSVYANHLYSATSITTTGNKCIEIAGNTIREYHSEAGGSPYHSAITLNDTSIDLNTYDSITISAYMGNIDLSTNGGFNIAFRSANFSVNQTGASEYTWSMDSIKANGNILATGGVTAYSSSDIRLKSNIKTFDYIKTIKSLGNVYEFDYIKDGKHSIGLIAQNVQKSSLADLVDTDDEGYLKLNYWSPKLISLALGGISQIDDEVDKLKARVRELENEVEYLKK